MKANTSTSQKIGAAIFAIGAIYMFGLVLLVLGWEFTFFGQLLSRQARLILK